MKITNFPLPTNPNLGGIKAFSFIEIGLVSSFPIPVSFQLTNYPTLIQGASFKTGLAAPFSYRFDLKPNKEDNPAYYFFNLSGFYPEISRNILSLFEEMEQEEFLLIATDNNNLNRIVGTELTPLFFKYTEIHGLNLPNKQGLEFTFHGTLLKPPPFFKA